jgi:hypothetical protein
MAGATVTKSQSYHGTLDGTDVDTVTIDGQYRKFRVLNRSAHEIYFNLSNTGTAPAAPTVAGDNTLVLPAVVGAFEDFTWISVSENDVIFKLIAGSSAAYSVIGLTS